MSRKVDTKVVAISTTSSSCNTSQSKTNQNGVQSFLKWFKKKETIEHGSDIQQVPSQRSNGVKDLQHDEDDSTSDTLSVPTSPSLSLSSLSSRGSVQSTDTTGFAFIPLDQYNPFGNATQPEKIITAGPITDTYRQRIRNYEQTKEHDRRLNLTLRKKYNIFDTDTLRPNHMTQSQPGASTSISHPDYNDLSLPTTSNSGALSPDASSESEQARCRPRRHRRTVSDNSKDRKAGAYVHVQGKRKAPSPPIGDTGEFQTTLLSPSMSTLARKKRQAPAPPTSPTPTTSGSMLSPQSPKTFNYSSQSPQSPQSPKSPVKTVLNGGLFNEAEMAAIMNGQPIPQQSPQKTHQMPLDPLDDPQSTDTLKLERGMLRSNRESTASSPPLSPTKPLEVPTSSVNTTNSSPVISPRPWYKRSTSHNKDQSIPFKREITLLTMEKRKSKSSKKDTSSLPDVSYSRTSSLFDGFLGRISSSHHQDDRTDKRRSGIGMPNISELDREAAEIIRKEKENALNRAQADNDKYYDDLPVTEAAAIPQAVVPPRERRSSTKDLINRFEETNPIKFTVNSSVFVDSKAERYFPATDKGAAALTTKNDDNVKNSQSVSSSTTTTTSSSSSLMLQSILGNMSDTKATAIVASRNSTQQQAQPDTKTNCGNNLSSTTWICSFCTLENYNWRVICEVCERIRPYDRNKAPLAVVEPSLLMQPQPRFRYARKDEMSASSSVMKVNHETNAGNCVGGTNNLLSPPQKPAVGLLSKSASETSVSGALNQRLPSKSMIQSPMLDSKKLFSEADNQRQSLIESSAVVTTKPSVFVAPQPARHDAASNSPDLAQMRAARIAKFSEDNRHQRAASNEQPKICKSASQSPEASSRKSSINDGHSHKMTDKPLLTDRGSLEREKQRLRDMIRAMNAQALADHYPITAVQKDVVEVRKIEVGQGAIRKVFSRKSEPPPDKIITDTTNLTKEEKNTNVKSGVEKIAVPTILELKQTPPNSLLLLPSPIAEINEDDLSPSSPTSQTLVDQQIDSIYAKLKTDAAPESVEVGLHRRNTAKGLDDFRATLRKTRNRTNTLALNTILKNLEIAIGEGQHEQAAKLAMDLAKMKVSLTVRKQCQSDDVPTPVGDLKITNFTETNAKSDNLINVKQNGIDVHIEKTLDAEEGATALPTTQSGTLSFGWTCPLCTLINSPNRPGCVVCSETRPASYIVPAAYQVKEPYEVPVELRKFLNDDDNLVKDKFAIAQDKPSSSGLQSKNDLNRASVNRRSAEIFNIVITKEESPPKIDPTKTVQTKVVMTALTESPNITKNRYRGVDNYNPHIKNITSTYKSPLVVNPIVKPVRATKLPLLVGVIPKKTTNTSNGGALSQIKLTAPIASTSSAHYNQLLSLDNTNIVPNADAFECPVCMTEVARGAGVVLRECIHTFCRECIVNTVKYSEEAEVKCPYIDAKYSCDCVIQEREIRALMTKEAYDEHLAVSLKVAQHRMENAFHCRTPGCKGWCVFEDNDVNQFKCPICRITNCLTCRVIHDGLNCKQYQDRMNTDCDTNQDARRTGEMLADMIEKGEAMKCPICQVILMKKWGCDWLKCSMCKTEICWVTRGIRWGPEGKGDTSAGCKCGVNGVKCHPKCNYCH